MDGEEVPAEPGSDGAVRLVYGFTIEQTLRAEPGAIFVAWTEAFDTWFALPGAIRMTPRVGEPYWFDVEHDGERHPHTGDSPRSSLPAWLARHGSPVGAAPTGPRRC